ncbi:MAG TPA: 4-hydroxyphenylpyruvate dioxygenase [Casimicrobium huifangae]|jgi:4-hydroxyphenylpyruvate dioxygenase|nr:4-hydroxyphenylpyruvate dioxygenase [Casimicrobium huifangae]HQD65905.1 4-hydroxyphenylpyruvate dioxygenase [Casimicrobium huifangae]
MTETVSKQKSGTTPPANPLGVAGIEYVEYATHEPQSFGAALEKLGFVAVARHRSREIVLYRAGGMNVIVNADPAVAGVAGGDDDEPQTPRLKAFALRVRDAAAAYEHCVEKGAWPIVPRVGAMELNIPGISGVGDSIIYFVDRYQEFSIYDVDFKKLPSAAEAHPAIAGMHFFGIVQSIEEGRTREWVDFYRELFGFLVLPQGQYFGVLPKGTLLESPCLQFYLQLVEPPEQAAVLAWQEKLTRVGFGAPDITALVSQLRARGVNFVESDSVHTSDRGAVTYLGGTSFEFVKSHLPATE